MARQSVPRSRQQYVTQSSAAYGGADLPAAQCSGVDVWRLPARLALYHLIVRSPACLYRERNRIERFFNRIKQCRRVATRYDKLAANYLAFVQLASIRLWLRFYEFTP